MIQRVRQYIERKGLLINEKQYLVALSGGADSVALLHLLLNLGYKVEAAHCNFHLRGTESDRDELFCRELCAKLGVKLNVKDFDTQHYSTTNKVSIEMAARELRYDWFSTLCESHKLEAVCVAHHKNDLVETVLLNLVRGTGLEGLKGMSATAELGGLKVVRPLLHLTREEIEGYLAGINQGYVTDSTNLEAEVQRNVIRLKVLPILKELNPAVVDNIAKMAERLDDDKQLILWELLKDKGYTGAQVDQIKQSLEVAQAGKIFESPSHRLLIDRKTLVVEQNDFEEQKVELSCATIDPQKVKLPLKVRRVQQGDSFVPFGMKGRKLVSDYLTDKKVNLFDKQQQLVVVDASESIVWLVGHTISEHCRVTEKSAETVVLKVEKA